MKDKREIKLDCYHDMLEDAIVDVEAIINQWQRLHLRQSQIDEYVLKRDLLKAQCHLELSLASLAILLRKMAENRYIMIPEERRRDINSIIHSNRFEMDEDDRIYVYSQKGREDVYLNELLTFARSVL